MVDLMSDPAPQAQALQLNLRHVLWKPDPQRVSVTKFDPCFEHFCSVCGAHGDFGYGGDFSAGILGLYACTAHRSEVEKRWRRV